MRQGRWIRWGVAMAAGVLAAQLVVPTAWAESGRGLSISPVFSDVALKTSDQQLKYEVRLSNHSGVAQAFTLSAVDFGSLDEEGGVAFLGQTANELEHHYGLAAWMKLERTEVTVPAGGSADVRATIDNRANLAPGGHYGAVLATAITDPTGGDESRVGIRQVLSSLILLTKEGAHTLALKLVSQGIDSKWWRMPAKVDQRFANNGNVHVVPRGVVQVMDPAGRTVRRGALNEGSGAILPESFRRYHAGLDTVGVAWLPGRYRVVTDYRPDGTDKTVRFATSFWFIGAVIVWPVFVLGVAAVLALAWWLWWRPRRKRKLVRHDQ